RARSYAGGEKLRLSLGYGAESFPLLRSLLDRLDLEPGEVHFRPLLDMDWAHSQHNPVRNLDKSLLRSHFSDARKHDGDPVMLKIPLRAPDMTLGVQKRTVRVKLTTKQIYQKLPLPSRGHLIPSGFLGAVQRPFGCLEHLVRDGLSSIRVGDADRDRDREVFPR